MADQPQIIEAEERVALDTDEPIWGRIFTVAPLVLIGSREMDGSYNLAPKHMVAAMGWSNRFGFVCTPQHTTYQNIRRDREFTVSFPRPSQVVMAAIAASPRSPDGSKPDLSALPTFEAHRVDGVYLRDAYLHLGCEIERFIDGLGPNSLLIGRIVEAFADPRALRDAGRDDEEVLDACPLLAYVDPGRCAQIDETRPFPLPEGFQR